MSATSTVTSVPASMSTLGVSANRRFKDRLAAVLVAGAFVLAAIPLVWILFTVITKGAGLIVSSGWWTESQRNVSPRSPGGGAYQAIMGTLIQAAITSVIAIPLGILGGVFLVEYGATNWLSKPVSFMVDILTGVPSIVSALFVYALWITTFGLRRMGFAVSLALVLMMIPTIVRSTEEMLRIVPNELRDASFALGIPKWKTILKVVVPTALTGIITGVMLGVARIMGETAPLLILVGYAAGINFNPFSGEQAALPLMINVERQNVLPAGQDRAWAAALTLILIVMVLNLGARYLGRLGGARR